MQLLASFPLDKLNSVATAITTYVAKSVGYTIIQATPVYFLWNFTLPHAITLINPITYAQSFCLILLLRLLTRTWTQDNLQDLAKIQITIMQQTHSVLYNLLLMINTGLMARKTAENIPDKSTGEIK